MGQDFRESLNAFTSGVKSLQLQRSLNTANEKVHEIKTSELKEAEQMQAIRGVANDLTMSMVGMGANQDQIASAMSAFKPQEPSAFQQNIYLETLKNQNALTLKNDQQGFDAIWKQKQLDNDRAVAGIKASNKDGLKVSEVKDLKSLDVQLAKMTALQKLTQRLGKPKPGLGNVGVLGKIRSRNDPDYAYLEKQVENLFNTYRKAVTGASATEGELAQLRQELPGLTNDPKQFQAKLQAWIDDAQLERRTTLDTWRAAGREVKAFARDGTKMPMRVEAEFLRAPGVNSPVMAGADSAAQQNQESLQGGPAGGSYWKK